jgi:hypothetical protein
MVNAAHKPPPVLCSAHVLEYAIVDDSVTYTGKYTLHVDGKPLGPVPRLAICRNLGDDLIHLFHCDEGWGVLGASGGRTVEDTKAEAESTYKGITQKWQASGVTVTKAQEFQDDLMGGVMCSFCGKRPEQIQSLVRSAYAAICDECVSTFHRDLGNDSK